MQVDVRQQRRDHRTLRRAHRSRCHHAVFRHPGLQPLADQAEHPPVADPVFDEADQPVVADRIKERRNVSVQNPVHPPARDPHRQRVQRVVLAAAGAEPRS